MLPSMPTDKTASEKKKSTLSKKSINQIKIKAELLFCEILLMFINNPSPIITQELHLTGN
jgi:hypothetical protein